MKASAPRPTLPLFPLPDLVHFPQTEIRLHVFEPRYRRLIRDLEERERGLRWIGMVLLKPQQAHAADLGFGQAPEIFREGTAGRLVDVQPLPDGRSIIRLVGEFRFAVEHEVEDLSIPYRRAVVRPLEEEAIDEEDPGVAAVRRDLLATAEKLVAEMGDHFPVEPDALADLGLQGSFEALVNGLAADLDLPALRKIDLLGSSLPERALELLQILESRRQVLDLLRPYRGLAAGAAGN